MCVCVRVCVWRGVHTIMYVCECVCTCACVCESSNVMKCINLQAFITALSSYGLNFSDSQEMGHDK